MKRLQQRQHLDDGMSRYWIVFRYNGHKVVDKEPFIYYMHFEDTEYFIDRIKKRYGSGNFEIWTDDGSGFEFAGWSCDIIID